MKRDPKLYIQDILESIDLIKRYTNNATSDIFTHNLELQDAVARRLIIIGEAVKNMPKNIKNKYSDIPWKKITGMRDIITHDYFSLSTERIWNTIKNDLDELKKSLEKIE